MQTRTLQQLKVAAAHAALVGSSVSADEGGADAPQPRPFFNFTGQKADKHNAETPSHNQYPAAAGPASRHCFYNDTSDFNICTTSAR